MRLHPDEREGIKRAASLSFGPDVVVKLYGSRLDDGRRGGDVDLLIETDGPTPDYVMRSLFLDRVQAVTDGKKIDLLFVRRGEALVSPFQKIALRDGRPL